VNNIRINLSLRTKLVLAFAIISVFVAGITARGLYSNLSGQVLEEFRQRAFNTVAVAALQQNGDEFEQIRSADDPLYKKFLEQNIKIRKVDEKIAFVFTARKDENGFYFVVDAGQPGEPNIAVYGERYTDPSPVFADNYDTMTGPIVDQEIYTDKYGTFISGYAPIFNSKGERVGAIGVDILADTIIAKQNQILVQSILILLLGAALGIFFGYVIGTILSEPLKTLKQATNSFSQGEFDLRVDIQTGDEIEELGLAFNNLASQIQALVKDLENRVSERTSKLQQQTDELEKISTIMQDRAQKLRAIAEVARGIISIQNLDELLPTIASVVSQEFGFYHVGIFLNDDNNKFSILRAANSEGGKRMLERGHKLAIGHTGLVGYTTYTGRARIALDTGSEAVFFNNPDLPETRSEIALPLRLGRDVIGALDVQSTQAGAFTPEDIELLSVLADQVSTAIHNARLFAETRRALEESEQIYRQYISQQWQAAIDQGISGAKYSGYDVLPLTETVENVVPQVMASPTELSIPIKLRGESIGVINVRKNAARKWNPDEIDIAQSIADRVAIALENVRLLNDAQRRASKERVIGNIASRLSSSTNLENVFTLALEELGHIIPGAEIVVQLDNPSNKKNQAGKG
jgi:GAF domain-containing protein/HAMP domain-containing protein